MTLEIWEATTWNGWCIAEHMEGCSALDRHPDRKQYKSMGPSLIIV